MKQLFVMLSVLIALQAQGIGVSAGGNAAVMTYGDQALTNTPDPKGSTDFVLGVNYDLDIFLGYLHVGANYATISADLVDVNANVGQFTMNQIQIPVMLKMYIFPWVVRPYIMGGAIYQLNLSMEYEGDDLLDYWNASELVPTIGVGLNLELPKLPIIYFETKILLGALGDGGVVNKQTPQFGDGFLSSFELNQVQAVFGVRF